MSRQFEMVLLPFCLRLLCIVRVRASVCVCVLHVAHAVGQGRSIIRLNCAVGQTGEQREWRASFEQLRLLGSEGKTGRTSRARSALLP